MEIAFDSNSEADTFLDFHGTEIKNLIINGKPSDHVLAKSRVALSNLKKGRNLVTMSILNKYRDDGYGLHSFIDQVDKQQYLYTQFEPAYSHFVFP